MDNAGNGISEPQNLKCFWGAYPQTVIPPTPPLWSAFGLLTFFPFAWYLQNLTLRPWNLYESRKLAIQDSFRRPFPKSVIINLQLLWIRYKQETTWNAAYYFENACLRKFHSFCVIQNRILNENGIVSFSETATILVKLMLVMPVTNALSERSYCSLRGIKNYLRSTMTQKRINKLMLMSVYKEDADN